MESLGFPLAADLDPDTTLEIILESLGDLVDYDLAVVLGLDREGDLAVRKARGPLYHKLLDGFHINLDARPDLRDIIDRRNPHLFDPEEDHLDTYHGVLDLPDGHSCLVAPLYIHDRPLGLLTFDHRSCNRFTPGIVRFVATMSRLVALVLAQSDRSVSLEVANRQLVEERLQLLGRQGGVYQNLVGDSAPWRRTLELVEVCASSSVPVLIRGETGTGKEGLALAIHRLSPRSAGPLVSLNCSAMSESLAESELFGHEKGAFTGAATSRKGRFELADGGTLFLDEIGDLPPSLQPKLLRAIQEGTFERLGGERTIRVDVRVVAATHVDLEEAMAAGRFRSDLFYRLNVFPLQVPPLRQRAEDIPLLAIHFLEQDTDGVRAGKPVLTPKALDLLTSLDWPGNVRQLRNTLQRARLLAGSRPIEPQHILPDGASVVDQGCLEGELPDCWGCKRGSNDPLASLAGKSATPATDKTSLPTWDQATRQLLARALELCGGRIYGPSGAAAALGLKPSTLQDRLRRHGLG